MTGRGKETRKRKETGRGKDKKRRLVSITYNWKKVEKKVKELQIRIAKAVRSEHPGHFTQKLAF